jgi:hypothetical protein
MIHEFAEFAPFLSVKFPALFRSSVYGLESTNLHRYWDTVQMGNFFFRSLLQSCQCKNSGGVEGFKIWFR